MAVDDAHGVIGKTHLHAIGGTCHIARVQEHLSIHFGLAHGAFHFQASLAITSQSQ